MSNQEPEMKEREHDGSDVSEKTITETTEAAEMGTTVYQKMEKSVVEGYKKIENGVVNGYKKIEGGVVERFNKIVDQCVAVLFARKGESVEDAKARLNRKNQK